MLVRNYFNIQVFAFKAYLETAVGEAIEVGGCEEVERVFWGHLCGPAVDVPKEGLTRLQGRH